ncbi:UNVERIFIED_CONTAM: hypothetical protein NCL1_26478 [Trichonephila clavipes]
MRPFAKSCHLTPKGDNLDVIGSELKQLGCGSLVVMAWDWRLQKDERSLLHLKRCSNLTPAPRETSYFICDPREGGVGCTTAHLKSCLY